MLTYAPFTRNKAAALTFIKEVLKRHGNPEAITTDDLRSYGAAMNELGNAKKQEVGRWPNNRVESSHLPFRRREGAMLGLRQMRHVTEVRLRPRQSPQSSSHKRHLIDRQAYKQRRSAALAGWQHLAS